MDRKRMINIKLILQDQFLVALSVFLFLIIFQPFGIDDLTPSMIVRHSLSQALIVFCITLSIDLVLAYVWNMPDDFSKDSHYFLRKSVCFYIPLIVLLPLVQNLVPWKTWEFSWYSYWNTFLQDLYVTVLVFAYMTLVSNKRRRDYEIQELIQINEELAARKEQPIDTDADNTRIILKGDSKEFLEVIPSEIVFIESVSNYISVCYFDNGTLKRKRLRSTLKNIEEALTPYPFIVHCHRAFVVNIRYITDVEGNSSECSLHLLELDRPIPVSRANIRKIRELI